MASKSRLASAIVGCVLAAGVLTAPAAFAGATATATLTYSAGDAPAGTEVVGHLNNYRAGAATFLDKQTGAVFTCGRARLDGRLGTVGSSESRVLLSFYYNDGALSCGGGLQGGFEVNVQSGGYAVINPVVVPNGLQAVLHASLKIVHYSDDRLPMCSIDTDAVDVPATYLNAHSAFRVKGSLGRAHVDGSCAGFNNGDTVQMTTTLRLRAHTTSDNPISITLDPAAG